MLPELPIFVLFSRLHRNLDTHPQQPLKYFLKQLLYCLLIFFHLLKTCTVKDEMILSHIQGACPNFSEAFGIWKELLSLCKAWIFIESQELKNPEHLTLFLFITPLITLTIPKAMSTPGWIKGGLHIKKSIRNEHYHSKNIIPLHIWN